MRTFVQTPLAAPAANGISADAVLTAMRSVREQYCVLLCEVYYRKPRVCVLYVLCVYMLFGDLPKSCFRAFLQVGISDIIMDAIVDEVFTRACVRNDWVCASVLLVHCVTCGSILPGVRCVHLPVCVSSDCLHSLLLLAQVLDGVCGSVEALVASLRARGVPGRVALDVKSALSQTPPPRAELIDVRALPSLLTSRLLHTPESLCVPQV